MFLWLNNLPNPGGSASTVVDPEPPPEESTPVANSSQLTTFSDLYTDLQNRVRVATGVTATETQAKRYINIAIHDINLGFQYKLPWLERNAQLRTHAAYTTGTPEAETRALWAVTMELPAAAASGKHRMLLGVGQ